MTVDDHIEQELQEVAEHLEVYRILIIDDPSLEPLIPIENRLEVIKPPERSPERFVTCGELLSVRPPRRPPAGQHEEICHPHPFAATPAFAPELLPKVPPTRAAFSSQQMQKDPQALAQYLQAAAYGNSLMGLELDRPFRHRFQIVDREVQAVFIDNLIDDPRSVMNGYLDTV